MRTTALYWMNIYNGDGNDLADLLAAKFWLKRPKKPQPESEAPINLNLDQLPKISMKNFPQSLASKPSPNYLSKVHQLEEKLNQIQGEKDQKIKDLTAEKETLQDELTDLSEQNTNLHQEKSREATKKRQIQQDLAIAKQTIQNLQEQLSQARENSAQQKQTINDLNQQLQSERKINTDLTKKYTLANKTISTCRMFIKVR